jgi:16S rRNA (guanine527-N7)-methyltransferase
MDPARIAELLHPFLDPSAGALHRTPRVPHPSAPFALGWEPATTSPSSCHSEQSEESASLSPTQLQHISTYIDLLLRWNTRINLTAIRAPEEIVTRHFGESLFAARYLFPAPVGPGLCPGQAKPSPAERAPQEGDHPYLDLDLDPDPDLDLASDLIDFGSGAGFPGLPIKIWAPHIRVTLIESNQKKATFLREVVRALTLTNVNVFSARAEDFPGQAAVVTLRAVERFDSALPIATRLIAPGGRLALLIGSSQANHARQLLPAFRWTTSIPVPSSDVRILLIGSPRQPSGDQR